MPPCTAGAATADDTRQQPLVCCPVRRQRHISRGSQRTAGGPGCAALPVTLLHCGPSWLYASQLQKDLMVDVVSCSTLRCLSRPSFSVSRQVVDFCRRCAAGGSQTAAAVEASAAAAAMDAPAGGGGDVLSTAVAGLDTINNAQLLLNVFDIDSTEFTERWVSQQPGVRASSTRY
jgi:hypothetical protein